MVAQKSLTKDTMDLDAIYLSNTECYKFHKKGQICRNCRSGNKNTFTPHRKKPQGLMVMEFNPQSTDCMQNSDASKTSKESKTNIEGSTEPDPRIKFGRL